MFCGKCGKANKDTSTFCINCGAQLSAPVQHQTESSSSNTKAATMLGSTISFLKKRWMIVAPALIIVLILLFCMNSIIMMISPTAGVFRASKATSSMLEKRIADSPFEMLKSLTECFNNGSIKTSFSYDSGYGMDASGDILILSNYSEKNYGFITNLTINDNDLDLTALVNKDRIAFNSTLIDDEYYGVTYSTFESDIKKFADIADLDDQTVDTLTKFVDYLSSSMNTDNAKLFEKYAKLFEKFFKDLKPSAESEKISVNGENISCKAVKYEITADDLDQLLRDLYQLLSNDQEMRAYLSSYLDMQNFGNEAFSGMMGSYGTSGDPDDLYDNMLSSFDDAIDSFKDEYSGTIDITFFVSSNKLIRSEVSGSPKISGEKISFDMTMDFGKHPDKNDLVVNVKAEDNTGSEIKLKATLQSEFKAGVQTDELSVKTSSDGSSDSFSLSSEWTKKTGDISLSLNAGGFESNVDGNLKFTKGGFTLVLDDLIDQSLDMGSLDLSITAQKGANIPKPNYINLDKWDSDFIDKLEDAADNLSDMSMNSYDSGF